MAEADEPLRDQMIRQTLTVGLAVDLVAMVLFILDPSTQLTTALLVGCPSLGLAAALALQRAGRVSAAGWLGVVTATSACIALVSFFWGIDGHVGVFLTVGIIMSGLIMGPRASLLSAVASLAYVVADYTSGPFPWAKVAYEPTRWEQFIDLSVALVLVGSLSAVGMGRVHRLLLKQRRDQELRAALLRGSPTPTLILDGDGDVVDANAAMLALCGVPVADFLGRPASNWLASNQDDGLLKCASGSVPVRVRSALVDAGEQALTVVAVTDQRAQQEVLRRQTEAIQAAEQASRAKSVFLASMSHELRTPLNAIIGYAELLDEEVGDEGMRRDLDRILNSGRHLLALVDQVLDMSRVEAGRMEVQWADFDLAETLAESISAVEGHALRRKVVFDLRCAETLWVTADSLRARQVLLNLLSNALRFADKRVMLDAFVVGNVARVVVSDDGPGVAPSLQARLFQPFVCGDGPQSQTGLGLALSRELARRMHGSLELGTMGPLGGASFVFELPLASG